MAGSLDVSLDDLIKKGKPGRPSAEGAGPSRRRPTAAVNRPGPYPPVPKGSDSASLYGVYTEHVAAAMPLGAPPPPPPLSAAVVETGTKLYISNLEHGVTNEDILELFSVVGELKRHSVNYDKNGKSKGTAEVVFARRADAQAAIQRYNNVQLDGKPMKIELIGTNVEAPLPRLPVPVDGALGKQNLSQNMSASRAGRGGQGRWSRGGNGVTGVVGGGSGGGGGRNRGGRSRTRAEPISAADLDAELERYHAEAAKTDGQA